jgi:hypothetical protein
VAVRFPGQWAQLNREWPTPAPISFGVCCNSDDDGGFDYIAALPASTLPTVPAHWHAWTCRRAAIWWPGTAGTSRPSARPGSGCWIITCPSGLSLADAPDLERYDTRFDEHTGNGGVEIWLPVDERPADKELKMRMKAAVLGMMLMASASAPPLRAAESRRTPRHHDVASAACAMRSTATRCATRSGIRHRPAAGKPR